MIYKPFSGMMAAWCGSKSDCCTVECGNGEIKIFDVTRNANNTICLNAATVIRRKMEKLESKPVPERANILWLREAIVYLGLDRLGISRPDLSMHRLIRKGALHPKKISGHLAFDKAELEKLVANGDHKRGRGRPRK